MSMQCELVLCFEGNVFHLILITFKMHFIAVLSARINHGKIRPYRRVERVRSSEILFCITLQVKHRTCSQFIARVLLCVCPSFCCVVLWSLSVVAVSKLPLVAVCLFYLLLLSLTQITC